jgi:hypothetical protein
MKELITRLVTEAKLSDAQANQVAEILKKFLAEKLPEAVRGPVMGALTGENIGGIADKAKGMFGKLF